MDNPIRARRGILYLIMVLAILCLNAAYAEANERIVDRLEFKQGTITVDMSEPVQADSVTTYTTKNIPIEPDDFETVLGGAASQGSISIENKPDEITYSFSLDGTVGLCPLLRTCGAYQTESTPNVQAAVDSVKAMLTEWKIPCTAYFVGRKDDVIRLGACEKEREQVDSQAENENDITAILFRYPVGDLFYDMNSYVFNPARKPNEGFRYGHDCGGYVTAIVRDDGAIENLNIVFPVETESKAGEVKCVKWQEALNKVIDEIQRKAEEAKYKNCNYTIRRMELTQIADDRAVTHPIWNVDVEQTIGHTDSDRVENYITSYQINATNGELLWPEEER